MVVIQTSQGYLTMDTAMAEAFYRAIRKATKKAVTQGLK
jgi:ribosomal protein S5